MINAMMSPAPAAPTVNQPATTVPGSTDPNAAPLPNPWGAAPAATNPASNPAGGLGGFPAGLGGSGLPDMSSLMNNPEAMSSMMNNPMMQQMMRSMSRNPAILQQMMDSNPMIQSNPAMREAMSSMMANPQLLQQMFEPSNMQAMLQMQRSMQQLQANGLMPGMTGMDPMMMQQLMGGQGMGAAPAPVVDPEVTWATQIQQLQDMGFYDRASNISALRATNGNVNLAVERLLAMFQ
jgi:ubiquilin